MKKDNAIPKSPAKSIAELINPSAELQIKSRNLAPVAESLSVQQSESDPTPATTGFAHFEQLNVPKPEAPETITTTATYTEPEYDYDFNSIGAWGDKEIVSYYDRFIKGASVSDLDEPHLEIVARYGKVAKSRRDVAEEAGETATIEGVRRKVQEQVDRQALAAYIAKAQETCINNLKNKRDNTPTVEIEFRFGQRRVVFTAEELAGSFGTVSNKINEYRRAVTGLLDIVKQTALEKRRKIEHQGNRNFTSFTTDIRTTTFIEQWKAEDAKE